MPQETKSGGFDGAVAAAESPSLQGLAVTRDDERALLDALEQAFDYRGDVMVTLEDGRTVAGYIFDRRTGATLIESRLRLLPADSDERLTVRYCDIARLEFSGRDAAHGKSFERWLKKYVEKRLAGERASIESEPLA